MAVEALTDRSELGVEGDSTAKDTPSHESEGLSISLSQASGGGQLIYEVAKDENIERIAIVTPETPRLETGLSEVQVDSSTTKPTSPPLGAHLVGDEVSQKPARNGRSSPSVPSEIMSSASTSSAPRNDPDVEEESEQTSDEASDQESDSFFDEQSESGQSNADMYSGPGSGVGFDGSAFSRPPPRADFAPPPSIVKMLEEGLEADSLNTDDAQDISSPLHSDVEQTESKDQEPSTFKHSVSNSLSSEDEASDEDIDSFEDHDAAQRRSSMQTPSPDQLGSPDAGAIDDQALKDSAATQLVTTDQGSWKGIGIPQDDHRMQRSSSPSSPHPSGSRESQRMLALRSQEILSEKAEPELIPNQGLADSSERKSQSSDRERIDSSAASDKESTLDTSPEKDQIESTVPQDFQLTHRQDVVLDPRLDQMIPMIIPSQGQNVRERADHSSAVTSVVQQTTVEIIDLESGDEDNLSSQDAAQKDFEAIVDESDSRFVPTLKVPTDGITLMSASDTRNEHQTSIDEAFSIPTVPDSIQLVLKPVTELEEVPPAGIPLESEAHGEAFELEQKGSGTQSLVAGSKRYKEEPPLTQEASLVQSEGTPKNKETESLSEERSQPKKLGTVETELEPILTDQLPSTVPDSFDQIYPKSQLLTPSSTQQTNFVSQPSSVSLHSTPQGDTLPTPRLTQAASVETVPRQPLASPEEPTPAKTSAPPKKTSTLIEKLKEMRRLSSQSPKPRSSDASILDPWFAPRRLSQVVPDSEDVSEAEESPEREAQAKFPKIASEQLPQTPEKPLAKTFIRSPSHPKHISSIQSSPQYLPPSQPPPPGFRTNLSYFVPLATLPSHFATTVDVLVIALSSTPVTRATSGPKDYNQSLYITDPSSLALQHSVTTAQIFRPNNRCFPIVEKGAALLLRDFKVQPFEKRLSLLSSESSAWAVFRKGADVQTRGPPVEYGAEERRFARGLWDWWASLGDDARKRLENALPEYKKPNGTAKTTKSKADGNKSDAPIKKEIEGLGVDLPGSQRKRRESITERSLALDGVEERDMVYESIEAPKRVLRARGAKGVNGRSESARESRFGTVFTGGLGEPDETQGSAHELRDGKAYRAKGR